MIADVLVVASGDSQFIYLTSTFGILIQTSTQLLGFTTAFGRRRKVPRSYGKLARQRDREYELSQQADPAWNQQGGAFGVETPKKFF